jgi:hypothetical protein
LLENIKYKGLLGKLPLDMRIIKIDLEVLELNLLAQDKVPCVLCDEPSVNFGISKPDA